MGIGKRSVPIGTAPAEHWWCVPRPECDELRRAGDEPPFSGLAFAGSIPSMKQWSFLYMLRTRSFELSPRIQPGGNISFFKTRNERRGYIDWFERLAAKLGPQP